QLFREYADQIIFGQLPVRGRVLFREEPPKAVASSVQVLRWMYGLYYGAFVTTVVLALVSFSGLAA
ncbi:hypothetical protein LI094_13875, partial [[Clostridium] saccharogumia]|uniref:hypothetical protein n=1 Tax=Thomasclavelia saccharogumia TaxID=341225 RepID=UPI001D06CEDB